MELLETSWETSGRASFSFSDAVIEKYKERRVRDAQAPVGSTDFDDLDATDSDAEESDDDVISLQPRYRRGPMAGFFSSDTLPSRTDNTQAPVPGSRIDDYFDNLGGSGSTGQLTDTILASAGLTVHGAGFLSYPGEGLVKDGLSYVGNAIHSI